MDEKSYGLDHPNVAWQGHDPKTVSDVTDHNGQSEGSADTRPLAERKGLRVAYLSEKYCIMHSSRSLLPSFKDKLRVLASTLRRDLALFGHEKGRAHSTEGQFDSSFCGAFCGGSP
jgi:hypothetical protein